jgi:outer membrane protein assembly factor BamB
VTGEGVEVRDLRDSPMQTENNIAHWRRRPGRLRIAATLVCAIVALTTATIADADDWPMFHRDNRHTGLSTETTIRGSNADSLTFQWVVNTGAPSYVSPAVAFNSTLGKSLAYVGNQVGTVTAYDTTTGDRVWWFNAGAAIQSSPAVAGNTVYVGSSDHKLYALNATTGGFRCAFTTSGVVASSPVVANLAGVGDVVFVGENGLSGADDGGHVWAIKASDCSQLWVFDGFGEPPGSATLAGSWSPISFARDVNGRSLAIFGGSSSDSGVYAVDARTGQRVWRFQAATFAEDDDVGAGATVSPPGMNGFADGVVYISGKSRIVYALNLRTGQFIWQFSIRADSPTVGGSTRSTAALVANRLYVGYGAGLYALNALTGAKVWRSRDVGPATPEVISSPAVSGPIGDRAIVFGDMGGKIRALNLATGAPVWSYATGGFIYASPALANGKVFITSSDGFLYSFGFGGGASAKPETTLVSPAPASTIPNPNGSVTLSGSASDDTGVDQVLVAVKNSNANRWWDPSILSWVKVFTQYPATLSNAGGSSTNWTATFPAPPGGGPFYTQAEAVDGDGQHDPTVAVSRFTIDPLGSPPATAIASPRDRQIFYFPLNGDGTVNRTSFPVTITGSASDPDGTKIGIARVYVAVTNYEHQEFYCGASGCPGNPTELWRPQWTQLQAQLASPGSASTTWSVSFPVYDHPHSYKIQAWAVDRDGEVDQTRAISFPVCVRDPGSTFCSP